MFGLNEGHTQYDDIKFYMHANFTLNNYTGVTINLLSLLLHFT